MKTLIRQIERWALLLPVFAILSGCSSFVVKSNTLEEITPFILLYLDQTEDGLLQQSTIIPPLKKEQKRVITIHPSLLKEGKHQLDHKYYREMKTGQLRMVFVSETLARKGLMDSFTTLLLDPDISDRVYLAVVKGDMIGFLNHQLRNKQEQIDLYLYKMLVHYEKQGSLTISNLHQFMERLYDPYADPVVPFFSVNNANLVYQGTALFQDDRMTGAILQPDDVYFQMLSRRSLLNKTVPIPDLGITLGEVYSSRSIRFSHSYREAQIDVRLRGRVEEYRSHQGFSDSGETALWLRKLERHFESDMERLIRRIQSLSADPMAMGKHTLGLMHQPFSGEEWKTHWPDMRVRVRVRLNLEHLGMLKPNESVVRPGAGQF